MTTTPTKDSIPIRHFDSDVSQSDEGFALLVVPLGKNGPRVQIGGLSSMALAKACQSILTDEIVNECIVNLTEGPLKQAQAIQNLRNAFGIKDGG